MNALSTRLQQARGRLFVGRTAQLECFALALQEKTWPVAVWHLHGLGGMGKTSLLRQWKAQAQAAGLIVISLDGRDFEPTSAAFCHVLSEALSEALQISLAAPATSQALCAAMEKAPARVVLQVDTYELLAPLDRFLRESFLPHLPENATVMLAGREELPFEWHSDAAWRELVRDFNLDGLSPGEGKLYLQKRGIEAHFQSQLLEWAHGHPLALSLAADVWLQHPGTKSLENQVAPSEVAENQVSSSEAADKEVLRKGSEPVFSPADLPHLVGPLLEHLVREVPTPAHRAALEASAIVLSMTQELLADMLGDLVSHPLPNAAHESPEEHAVESTNGIGNDSPATKNDAPATKNEGAPVEIRAIFEWLRGLSMMQSHRFGIFPHDLARELLVADLHWRSPDWHVELHRRAREHYLRRIHRVGGAEQQRAIFNCIYLHRLSPVVGPYLRWNDSAASLDSARPEDVPALLDMVEKHEGKTSRDLAARHFEAQPDGLVVVRDPRGLAQGFVFQLALKDISDALYEADPGAKAARDFLRGNAPLRAGTNGGANGDKNNRDKSGGENATLFRFWMDKDIYQEVGATQSLIFVQVVRHYLVTPQLAFSFFPCADPDFWNDGFLYADLFPLPAADFEVEGRKFGVFGHDWRARPVLSWLDLLSQREMQSVTLAPEAAPLLAAGTDFVVLDEAQFHAAVYLALRSSDAAALRRNPLLQTAFVHRHARQIVLGSHGLQTAAGIAPSLDERILSLRTLLKEAVAELEAAPRQEKAHRAVELVFGRRALSQEAAAAAMDVSHSSLRRYLHAGVTQVAAALHERENH
ncbi:hypothetical protein B1R32_1088 [Abditibacterium utsteinense]|uniref:AAA ATPase domain-containing protein n=1 Tax=Abditibacterium utsteinense TaxID=1960156 RepID=A0A2S8SSL0_9BACT|nr:ATP-binding protein [Abditibacterium utsteinense]PQV63804.1 hypothetical protein B1R32_1088 [Abditibacterium utsteinense]